MKLMDVTLVDEDGYSADKWCFDLLDDIASFFLQQAFDATIATSKELWVKVPRWDGKIPIEVDERTPPPVKPVIARDFVEMLTDLDQRSIETVRGLCVAVLE